MDMKKTAGLLQAQGRHGDTILAHINPQEAKMLKAAGGSGTINPETGLPEYFSLGGLFKTAAVVVGAYFLGPAGAGMLSAGATTGAMIGAGVSGLTGGNPLKGALIGGIGGFVAGGGLNDTSGWIGEQSRAFFQNGTAAGNMPVEAAKTAASSAASQSGISTNAADFLNAGAPTGSMTDSAITSAMQPAAAAPPSFSMNEVAGYDRAAANAVPAANPGLLDRAMQWAGDNPVPALMAGQSAMAGIGGMATAESQAEQAQLNRDAQMQMRTVQGGFGSQSGVTAGDPNAVMDMAGRYIRGPLAGQYAPGRAPGLLNAARA